MLVPRKIDMYNPLSFTILYADILSKVVIEMPMNQWAVVELVHLVFVEALDLFSQYVLG
jgi:hypothetical protein